MIETKKDYLKYIEQDKKANCMISRCFKEKVKRFFLPNMTWCFLRLLRKYEYLKNTKKQGLKGLSVKIGLLYYHYRFRKLSLRLGFSIPLNVFGPGLSIPHYGTIVVSPAARVGENCRLHVGVNIGASSGFNKAPTIGDNVYVGPGAILFGDITIPDGVSVAANATVNKTINTSSCVIAGTPAEIVKEGVPVWWKTTKTDLG